MIDAIKNLLKQHCKICSFFCTEAFNVKGQTLQSILPILGKKCAELKGQSLHRLQNQQYLIIDEYSVICQKKNAWLDNAVINFCHNYPPRTPGNLHQNICPHPGALASLILPRGGDLLR